MTGADILVVTILVLCALTGIALVASLIDDRLWYRQREREHQMLTRRLAQLQDDANRNKFEVHP